VLIDMPSEGRHIDKHVPGTLQRLPATKTELPRGIADNCLFSRAALLRKNAVTSSVVALAGLEAFH
jgi:hypothetical protein